MLSRLSDHSQVVAKLSVRLPVFDEFGAAGDNLNLTAFNKIYYNQNSMASGNDIYSQLLISAIRISDISNSIIDITI